MKRLLFIFLALSLSLVSCKKWLGDNIDPATPQQVPSHVMLPAMFAQMERGIVGDARYIGRYIQNWGLNTASDAVERHGYLRNSDAMGEIWRQAYFGIGKNVDLMIEDANSEQKWEFVGAGLAIRAWCWQTATDYHGEIIIKQAFEEDRYVFDYDSQETAYQEVRRLCSLALDYFNRTDGKLGGVALYPSADLVYGGNTVKWKRFVNGLLARNAHNITNKASYDPQRVIDLVNASFTSNADNFIIPHPTGVTTQDNSNGYGPQKIPSPYPSMSGAYIQGNMIARLLNGDVFGVVDPRAAIMLAASPDGQFRGVKPAQADPNRNASATVINPTEIPNIYGIKSGTTPGVGAGRFVFRDNVGFLVMSYAEMQFIKAEAAFRNNDMATAYTAFKEGITAHMDYVGVSAAARNSYLANAAAVPQTSAALTLRHIMLQKYIAMFAVGVLETWVDMRRFDYDTTVYSRYTLLPDPSYTQGTLFEDNLGKRAYRVRPRFNSEYVWNLDALQKIGADKIDYHTVKPWFMLP